MNPHDPQDTGPDALEDRYRAASDIAGGRPADATREAILAHARARLGEPEDIARAERKGPHQPWTRARHWRAYRLAAGLAVVGLAGLLYTQARLQPPRESLAATSAPPRTMPQPEPLPAPAAAPDTGAVAAAAARAEAPPTVPAPALAQAQAPARERASAADANLVAAGAAAGLRTASAESRAVAPPLFRLVQVGGCARVGELLEAGARVDERDAQGRTALLLATQHGEVDCARRLLAAGADPDAADAAGDSPRGLALKSGEPAMTALFETATGH